jgi:ribonucleoside-diphosphate reductase alpha chain
MKIKKIEKRSEELPTWDIDVNSVHNYLLDNGVVSHNTSQIFGNVECFEMMTSNLYKRATLSGEFIQLNKYLVEDLLELGLWNDDMRQKVISAEGSIQNIPEIPDDLKQLYKTVWETSQKLIIDYAADRGPFICQSQSLNLYFKNASVAPISSAMMYAWEKGLKTLVYYTRNTSSVEAFKFTVDKKTPEISEIEEGISCSLDNPDECIACSG